MKVADPADSGSTYEPFQFRTLLQVSAALGVPYSYVTNDVTRGNFANSRLSLMEFRRRVEAWQHGVLVYQMCRPVWRRWMDTAEMAGALRLPGYERRRAEYLAAKWLPARWDWVDPLKDTNAELAQIAAGLKSRTQAVSERGYDAEQLDREIAAERERERALSLDYRQPGSPARAASEAAPADADPDRDEGEADPARDQRD